MSMSSSAFESVKKTQWSASNPAVSAWVSANAGSGKTHVLSQRVLRLLLRGVPPAKIVCLTYTKAAAANMAMKVFSTLAEWTRLGDADLSRAIADMGVTQSLSAADLALARRLFARTVETPGGLKIQTIHAFCERLLHLFPFEAGVAASFTVMEDEEVQQALSAACHHVYADAAVDVDLGEQLALMASLLREDAFRDIIKEVLGKRHKLADMLRHGGLARYRQRLTQWMDLPPDLTRATLHAQEVDFCLKQSEWKAAADALRMGSVSDQKLAIHFDHASTIADLHIALSLLMPFYFTEAGKGGPRARLMTTKLRDAYPLLHDLMVQEQQRLSAHKNKQGAFALVERTYALLFVFERIANHYRAYKALHGKLDFDDLIARTLDLLSRSTAAQWVLYKLDSGIDHILVDEAQDTSPEQWRILQSITEEFTAGFGQRRTERSFFAVGDEKQSIYSFQGAEPSKFSDMRDYFRARASAAELHFETVPLKMSFRSAPGVLAWVDHIFASDEYYKGLSSDNVALVHEAFKTTLPSHVELWPVIEKSPVDVDESNWMVPVNALDKNDPILIVARRIARHIADLIDPKSPERVADASGHGRPIRAGDIMILVRKRGPIFHAIIRALKEHNVPVAGADRLILNDHLAVMDLLALGHVLLLPDDDLTLACVLKSPLFDLSDDDLMRLAPQRGSMSLWDALSHAQEDRYRALHDQLETWRMKAHHLTPFEFYSYILNVMHGRRQFIARLGIEAGDALDEFVRLALLHERREPASLSRFLATMREADNPIKRDMEAAGNYVRVMTAHAAKGLEAKIIFMPDTTSSPFQRGYGTKNILTTEVDGAPLLFWTRHHDDPCETLAAREDDKIATEQEHRRLLYVALTRAEERLYIMGAGKVNSQSWYDIIHTRLADTMQSMPAPWNEDEIIWRARHLEFAQESSASAEHEMIAAPLPAWIHASAPRERVAEPPISPSSALAAADQFAAVTLSADELAERALFGRLMHVLVQYLPQCAPDQRAHAARFFVDTRASSLPESMREDLYRDALALFDDADMNALFAHPQKAEVALAGKVRVGEGHHINVAGQIDLLIDTPTDLVIVDFKTGTAKDGDATPEVYAAQLGLYRRLLLNLYPSRTVRCMLVWTSGPKIVDVPVALLEKALTKVKQA